MPRGVRKALIDEAKLSKGDKRSLEAIRKKLGQRIADKAFSEYLAKNSGGDRTYETIAKALFRLVRSNELKIPRKGITVHLTRGRKDTPVHARPYAPAKSRKPKRAKGQREKVQAAS